MRPIKQLLPIGSVVLLKDAKKRMMICGIRQTGKENKDREYDYMGVFYPEGHVGENYQFLFDHESIDKIFFRGYEDVERQDFVERLENYYQNEANVKQERVNE